MRPVLVLQAHPAPSRSRHNRPLFERARHVAGVDTVDLYELYPRFRIDVAVEQERLQAHDVLVLQFPLYWYSVPALLKEYLDRVLEFGFAYGPGGDRLQGKLLQVAVTAGGSAQAYTPEGHNRFAIGTLLTPLEQTAGLCAMLWCEPLVLYAASGDDAQRLDAHAQRYVERLEALRDGPPIAASGTTREPA